MSRSVKCLSTVAAAVFLSAAANVALAQSPAAQNPPVKGAQRPVQQQPLQVAPAPAPALAAPQPEQLLAMIRSTIVALNQANHTGNYTVLRDLAAPDFRNANDASRLAKIFEVLRDQGVDFDPLLNISPELTDVPAVDGRGFLRLAGFFPTVPMQVRFDLTYQFSAERWRPYAISVYLAQAQASAPPPAPALAPAKTSFKKQ